MARRLVVRTLATLRLDIPVFVYILRCSHWSLSMTPEEKKAKIIEALRADRHETKGSVDPYSFETAPRLGCLRSALRLDCPFALPQAELQDDRYWERRYVAYGLPG
jgi:hypothetical protein